MKKFLKLGISIVILLIFLFPLIFIWFLHKEKIGTIDGWLGFFGGYFGVFGAFGAVWWQLYEEKNSEIKGLIFYIMDILEKNCKTYNLEYIKITNYQACSMLFLPNYSNFKISLESLKLNKEDIVLLYKYHYKDLVNLNSEIDNVINQYNFTIEEEFIYNKVFSLILELLKIAELDSKCSAKNYSEPLNLEDEMTLNNILQQKESLMVTHNLTENVNLNLDYIKEIYNIYLILLDFSKIFSNFPKKIYNLDSLNLKIEKLKKDVILENIFKNLNKESNLNDLKDEIINFFKVFNSFNFNEIEKKYMIGLHILSLMIREYNIDLGVKLSDVNYKKISFFTNQYNDLYNKMAYNLKK